MSDVMKATPGPWRYVSRNIDEKAKWASRIPFAIEFAPAHGGGVAPIADVVANPLVEVCDQPQAEANARRIVQCVNSHDDLLAAAQAIAAELDPSGDSYLLTSRDCFDARKAVNALRAAIAKANGGATV